MNPNQITFIVLVSSENYYRRPRIIAVIAKGVGYDRVKQIREGISERVRGELLGRGAAIVHLVETGMSPRMKCSQFSLPV